MVEITSNLLRTQGHLSSEKAEAIAVALTDRLALDWGGQLIYFPTGTWNGSTLSCFELTKRDWQIFRTYNGTNRMQLCRRFKISQQRLYQIITSCRRELSTGRPQPQLADQTKPANAPLKLPSKS